MNWVACSLPPSTNLLSWSALILSKRLGLVPYSTQLPPIVGVSVDSNVDQVTTNNFVSSLTNVECWSWNVATGSWWHCPVLVLWRYFFAHTDKAGCVQNLVYSCTLAIVYLLKCGQHVNEYTSVAIVLVYSEMQHLKDASACHAGWFGGKSLIGMQTEIHLAHW